MSKLNELKTKIRKAEELQRELFMKFRSNKESQESRKAMENNRAVIEDLKKQYNREEIKQQVELFNNFQVQVANLCRYLQEYDGKMFKADNTYTKAFKTYTADFHSSYGFSFYLKRKTYTSNLLEDSIDLVVSLGQFKKEIRLDNESGEYEFNLSYINAETIIDARRKHKALLDAFNEAKKNLNHNYLLGV